MANLLKRSWEMRAPFTVGEASPRFVNDGGLRRRRSYGGESEESWISEVRSLWRAKRWPDEQTPYNKASEGG